MRLVPLPGVFQPISDSRMLAHCMLRERVAGASVLDLCTGSGFLAVTAALHGADRVVAVDVSRRALASVKLNAWLNRVKVEALCSNLFESVAAQRFDLIVSNPPYVPSEQVGGPGLQRAWAAGPDGRVFINRICNEVRAHLNPGGVLLLVQNTLIGEKRTIEALGAGGLDPSIALRHHGSLGPRLRRQARWLRARGMLDSDRDEVLIVRAQLPVDAAHEVRERHLLG